MKANNKNNINNELDIIEEIVYATKNVFIAAIENPGLTAIAVLTTCLLAIML